MGTFAIGRWTAAGIWLITGPPLVARLAAELVALGQSATPACTASSRGNLAVGRDLPAAHRCPGGLMTTVPVGTFMLLFTVTTGRPRSRAGI